MVKHDYDEAQATTHLLLKNLLRSLFKNWKQLISVIAISFLSVCLFSGLTSNAENIQERADFLYEQTNYADVYLTVSSPLTIQQKNNLTSLDAVDDVEGRVYLPVYHGNTIAYFVMAEDDSTISIPYMIEGERGLTITDTYASSNNLEVGSELNLSLQTSYLNLDDEIVSLIGRFLRDGVTNPLTEEEISLTFEVSGIMYHPEAVQSSTMSLTTIYADQSYVADILWDFLVQYIDIDRINSFLSLLNIQLDSSIITTLFPYMENQYLFTSTDPDACLEAIENYFSDSDDVLSCVLSTEMSQYEELKQECDQAMALTFVFPVIFFLVSLLVILTTLSQMIIKERSQIGAMKAIGVPSRKIYAHYTTYGMILCLIGAVLGFIVGPLMIPAILSMKYDLLWDLPSVSISFFYPLSILMICLLILISGLCAFMISFKVIREKPCETLKPKGSKSKAKPVKTDSFSSRHTSISLRMAFRNIFKEKGKSIMVVLGTLGCTAMLVCGFGIMDTLDYDIALDFSTNQNIDIMCVLESNSSTFVEEASEIDGIERVEAYYSYPITASSDNTSQVSVDLNLVEEDSSFLLVPVGVDSGVSLDVDTANSLDVEVGDQIRMIVNSTVYTKEVTYIFESSFLKGIYDLVSEYPSNSFTVSGYYITVEDGVDIDSMVSILTENFSILTIMTGEDYLEQADQILSTISTMTNIVKIFAILLSVVVLYNLTSLNIAERTRDIATMKVLGFKYREISKTLNIEIMLDVLVGALIGLFFGYPLMVLVLEINQTNLMTFIYHIQWYTYLISFAIAIGSSFIISTFLNLKAKKINMAESLKSVE